MWDELNIDDVEIDIEIQMINTAFCSLDCLDRDLDDVTAIRKLELQISAFVSVYFFMAALCSCSPRDMSFNRKWHIHPVSEFNSFDFLLNAQLASLRANDFVWDRVADKKCSTLSIGQIVRSSWCRLGPGLLRFASVVKPDSHSWFRRPICFRCTDCRIEHSYCCHGLRAESASEEGLGISTDGRIRFLNLGSGFLRDCRRP
jgi:hypothetical protein